MFFYGSVAFSAYREKFMLYTAKTYGFLWFWGFFGIWRFFHFLYRRFCYICRYRRLIFLYIPKTLSSHIKLMKITAVFEQLFSICRKNNTDSGNPLWQPLDRNVLFLNPLLRPRIRYVNFINHISQMKRRK